MKELKDIFNELEANTVDGWVVLANALTRSDLFMPHKQMLHALMMQTGAIAIHRKDNLVLYDAPKQRSFFQMFS